MQDQRTENYLKRHGCSFRFEVRFPLEKLGDRSEAEQNRARLDRRLDEVRALQYGADMEAGTDFPAILIFETGEDCYELGSGLHRWAAAELAFPNNPRLDAYIVIEPSEYRRDLLTRAANTIEGVGQSQRENLAHIAEIKRQNKDVKTKDLADFFRIRLQLVEEYLREVRVVDRAVKLGVGDYLTQKKFSQKLKLELGRINYDDLFIETVRLIHENRRLVGPTAIEFAASVRKAATVTEARKQIDDKRMELIRVEIEAKQIRTPPGLATRFMGYVRNIKNCGGDSVERLALSGLPGSKLPQELAILDAALAKLKTVRAEISHLIDQHERAAKWIVNPAVISRQPQPHAQPGA